MLTPDAGLKPFTPHRKVDALLQQLDMVMWNYQRAVVEHQYSGERPAGKLGCCGCSGEKVRLQKGEKALRAVARGRLTSRTVAAVRGRR